MLMNRQMQVFNAEGVLIRVMCRLVIVQHEVDSVDLCGDENDLEGCVPQGSRGIGPKQICLQLSASLLPALTLSSKLLLNAPRYRVM